MPEGTTETPAPTAPPPAAPTPAPPNPAPADLPKPAAEPPKAADKPKGPTGLDLLAKARRQEQFNRQERERIQREREAFQATQQDALRKAREYDEFAKLKNDRKAALAYLGIKPEDVVNDVIAGDKRTPEQIVEAKIAEFKAQQQAEWEENRKKMTAAQAERENGQRIEAYKARIEAMAKEKADDYELVNATGNYGQVWKLIEDYFFETEKKFGKGNGVVLNVKDALEAVEGDLLKKQEKLLESKKLKGLLDKKNNKPTNGIVDPKTGVAAVDSRPEVKTAGKPVPLSTPSFQADRAAKSSELLQWLVAQRDN